MVECVHLEEQQIIPSHTWMLLYDPWKASLERSENISKLKRCSCGSCRSFSQSRAVFLFHGDISVLALHRLLGALSRIFQVNPRPQTITIPYHFDYKSFVSFSDSLRLIGFMCRHHNDFFFSHLFSLWCNAYEFRTLSVGPATLVARSHKITPVVVAVVS